MEIGFVKRALAKMAKLVRIPAYFVVRQSYAMLQKLETTEHFAPAAAALRRQYDRSAWTSARHERQLGALLDAFPIRPFQAHGHVMIAVYGLGSGGAERQVVQTVLGLAPRLSKRLSVVIEASREDQNNRFYAEQVGQVVPIVETPPVGLPADALDAFLEKWLGPLMAERTRRYRAVFRVARPDVVHAWLDSTNICAGIAAVAEGVPRVLLSTRSVAPTAFPFWHAFMRPAYRAILARHDVRLLNNSVAGSSDYAQWLDIHSEAITLIRNGIPLDIPPGRRDVAQRAGWRISAGIPLDGPIVGGVFRIGPEKRPSLWLDVARRVLALRPATRFVVVGGGPMEKSFMHDAAAPVFRGRVHVLGPRKDALEAIASMDVLLHTSRIEGSPNVPVEAQLFGVPVVATPGGGTIEAVGPPPSGYLASSANADQLAHLVLKALDSGAPAAEAGPIFALHRFDSRRMIDETLTAYGVSVVE
jgi:glycosyltransferase involved in cell wall biosynthesis